MLRAVFFSLMANLAKNASASAELVNTINGTAQGIACPNSNVTSFLGLPYAQPPTGSLRYSAPKAFNSKYNGTWQATTQPPNCPQFGSSFIETSLTSEDW